MRNVLKKLNYRIISHPFRSTTYQYKYKTSIFPFAGLIESKMRLSECEGGGGYVWNCTECSYTSKRRNVLVLIILWKMI
jgi:hypothetical protein